MKSDLTKIDVNALNGLKLKVEDNSHVVDNIVNDIVTPYTKDLDSYVSFIRNCLKDGENPPTDYELEDFCMNLSTYIYFASGMCEQLGIRDDIAKAVYREAYNNARDNASGTVQDKNMLAELEAQQEQVISMCYTRCYKVVRAKVESAQELLSSCKKCLTRRMSEMELTKIAPTNTRRDSYEN